MSWAVEEWKEGLSTRVLHKIQELESHLEKLKKERQQKQFQLESLEAALQKQKQKVELEKNEGATLKRENQNLMELCDNLENTRQKLCHELQVKESQVNFQEGQLVSSKKQIEKLEQELKRYKSELEKSQKIHVAGDSSFNSTPQKNFSVPATPESKYEDLQAKYSKEVEERKRLEEELKSLKTQKTNTTCPESISRREIARQQASSSVFSWQQEKTPSRFSSSTQETPVSNGSVTSHLPQEIKATPSHRHLKSAKKEFTGSNVFSSSNDSPLLKKMKAQNQELKSRVQELEHKLQIQAQDMKFSLAKLQEAQLQLENMKTELTEKDKALNKTRNEMSRITAQFDQATDQCAAKEEKVKRLSEELNCQRQNFTSAQHALQEKIKEKEKECQKTLSAKEEFEKKANDLTQKLSEADQTMQTMQLKENELKNMCEEVKKQNSLISCQAAQQLQEIGQLKDELCVAQQLLQQTQCVSKDMKNKNCSLENELKLLEEKLNRQDNLVTLENMKLSISDLENQQDSLQQLLKHKENTVEELSIKLEELETMQKVHTEYEGLKKEIEILSQWKKEKEQLLNELGLEKEGLQSKICSLETALMIEQLKSHERLRALEDENERLSLEMKSLKCMVEDKTRELEVQRKANTDLQEKNAASEEKHRKERENNSLKLAAFIKQVDALQKELESSRKEVLEREKCIASLEASLTSYAQLDIHFKKQSEELSQARDEMQRKLMEEEQRHTDFAQEMGQQINRLQTALSDKQDLLTKALASLKERDEKMQMLIKESDKQQAVIQDLKIKKEQVIENMKIRNENATGDLTLESTSLEQLRVSVQEKEDELHKYHVKLEMLQMDLEDKEVSVENYIVQVQQLETVLRTMEIKLEDGEIEKENLKQELQALKNLGNQTSEMSSIDGNDESSMYFNADTKVSFNQERDANCSLVLHNLIPSQNDYVRLVSSLHMTMNKLNELEKICEHLRIEKSQLKDPQLECIMNTDTMAQALMNKINKVKEEGAPFSGALVEKSKIAAQSDMEQILLISLGRCDGIDYEDLKLSNKEIKTHFDSVKKKIFSLKKVYEIFQGQSLNMASKISELQRYTEMLKEKDLALSTSLYQVDSASFAIELTSSPVDKECHSDEKFCMEFPCCSETSYCTNVTPMESSFDSVLYKPPSKIGGLHNKKQTNLEGAADQHCLSVLEPYNNNKWASLVKQEHLITKRPKLKNKIEHLLCEPLEKSFKMLEESFRSHKNLEDKEIQKIQDLLLSVRKEVEDLQKQAVSDNKLWQQKLHNVILQAASTLTEKKHPELFSQEQEPQPRLEDINCRFQPLCVDSKHQAQIPTEQTNNLLCQVDEYDFSNEILVLETVKNKVTARPCEAHGKENKKLATEAEVGIKSTEKLLLYEDLETRNATNKSIVPINCPNVLSFPPNHSMSTVPVDFLENHGIMEVPYLEIKQVYCKNSKFSCDLEESSKNIDSLVMQIQCLNSNLDSKNEELAEKINVCTELNKTVEVLKQEKTDLSEALKSVTFDNQQLSYNLMTLGMELNKAKTDLEMYKVRLSDAADALDDLEITKADWTEKLLETENELRRIKSEKANVENHALFMEANIEELQSKNEQLKREKENELKTILGLQDQLCMITAERNQFTQDLSALSKDKEELHQKCQKMQKTIKELESSRVDSAEFIRILEAEAKTQAKLLQAAKADNNRLSTEKEGLTLQLQNLDKVASDLILEKEAAQSQIECLREEKEAGLREYETLHSKLSISEMENAKISKSLEGSLIEKGELAARLNSAQEEVDQLRQGIEKLKIKIEADEKSKHRLAEKLKETEWKTDSLVDKIEGLERELQMSEENLEGAILQAEAAKEETEIANAEIEKMRVTLQSLDCKISALKSEKECLERKLEEKQVKVSSLENSYVILVKQVEEEEKEKVKMRGDYERKLLSMESQLKDAHEEIKLFLSKQEILEAKEQDLINKVTSLRQENTQLVHHLEEGKYKDSEIEQLIEALIHALQDVTQKMDENSSFLEQLPKSESLQAISQESQGSFKLPEEQLEAITSEKCASLGKGEQLRKEYVAFHHKFQQWLESCRELKQEKKLMMNQIHKLETQLKMGDLCCHKDGRTMEMEGLGVSFEESAMEADQNLDKFCALLINHHKLEEENEMLRTQVSLLNARLASISSSPCQSNQSPAESSDRYLIEQASSEEVAEITAKRYKSQENRSISEEAVSPLLEAITKKRTAFQRCSPAVLQVNTEYESDGSPEVGREDLSPGNGSPCLSHPIVPRKSPCLVRQSLRTSQFCSNSVENSVLSENLKVPAEGSKLQKINNAQLQEVEVLGPSTPRSPLSVFNQADSERFERSAEYLHSAPTKCSLSSEENELDEACHVQ